jgi:hypothetical protein
MSDQITGHPHRCREGHRWQHMGPTAAVCKIAVDDSYTGDLPLVSAPDCPLCSRREDLLKRDLHTHYCNICEGSWDHEGRCVEGVVACCPWCFRSPSAPSAPGARRGAHFHFCPECTQNWQHDTSCSAPLRVALPDCSGCRELLVEPSTGERAVKVTMTSSPFRVHASAIDVVRAACHFIRPAVIPVSIVVGVILAVPLVINVSSTLWSLAPHSVAPVLEHRTADHTLGPVAPLVEHNSRTQFARPREPHGAQLAEKAPFVAGQVQLHRAGERQAAPAPDSARIAPPRELDVSSKPALSAVERRTRGTERMRPASSLPSPTPRELDTQSSQKAVTGQSEVSGTTSRDVRTPTKGTSAPLRGANTPVNDTAAPPKAETDQSASGDRPRLSATARPSPSAPARSNQVASAPPPEAAPPNATPQFGGSHADLVRQPVSRGWGDSYAVRLLDSAGRPLVFAEVLLVAHMADGTLENVPMGALPEPGIYRGTVPTSRSTPVGLRIRVRTGDKFVEVPVRP